LRVTQTEHAIDEVDAPARAQARLGPLLAAVITADERTERENHQQESELHRDATGDAPRSFRLALGAGPPRAWARGFGSVDDGQGSPAGTQTTAYTHGDLLSLQRR